ncbi:MAG: HlyD family efflux transporter periplasmic adaptor subunit [Alphaproteobacteria bacterium]|nr:HlyD family efflux transporter periplasmic adaptor subunit [Alphaproteobacteria bacterium]
MKMDNERAKLRPDAASPASGEAPSATPVRKPRKRLLLFAVLAIAAGYGGWKAYNWFIDGRFVVSTDDAYVKADQSIIAAKVPGLVAAVDVADNTRVKAGDTLVRIDDGDYRLAVEAARERIATQDAALARIVRQTAAQRASIEQAVAQLNAAQAEVSRANLAFARAESLARTGNGSVATFDQARADRDRVLANVAGARAGVEAANAAMEVLRAQQAEADSQRRELETALQRAERDLSFTAVRAPFDGTVGNRAAQPGQYVQPGTRLMALVPLDGVYIQANFKETQLAEIKPGQPVDLTVDAYPGRTIRGTVVSIAPASGSEFSLLPPENATGNFTKIVQRLPVRIAVPAEIAREGLLRPGMSVVAGVRTHGAPTVP